MFALQLGGVNDPVQRRVFSRRGSQVQFDQFVRDDFERFAILSIVGKESPFP